MVINNEILNEQLEKCLYDINFYENKLNGVKMNDTCTMNRYKDMVKENKKKYIELKHNYKIRLQDYTRILALYNDEIELLKAIRNLELNEIYIFPLRYHTMNQKIKDASKAIGLNPNEYRTHCLRATLATTLYHNCKDIKIVQSTLGHTDTSMTNKYIHNIESLDEQRKARESAMKKHIQTT